ncbi:hypothetical protein Taro_048837 [Colocasia esculenta]|uniref:Cupin type-1 domain-containing protein n=1 Tax=Colocasia esculenta TaxID=4460 RepID=A0A843X9D8_COLES|nr:hypothetical protein [Colocasia esculenta]
MAGGRVLSFLCWVLCLGILCHVSLAQHPFHGGERRLAGQRSECRLQNLRAQEASRRVESEAGYSEYWDANDQQFECAGVAAVRKTIQPRGLLLPEFSNLPRLVYIVQGRACCFGIYLLHIAPTFFVVVVFPCFLSGITGVVVPGCPETFHSFDQSQQQRREERPGQQRFQDQHQKIRRFRRGDIIAMPAGVSHWCYNNGNEPVIAVTVLDTSNFANQLGRDPKKFFLAGSQQREGWQRESQYGQEEKSGNNIFSGFDDEILSESLGVRREVVRKLKSEGEHRGTIIRVERGLEVVGPRMEEREEEEEEREKERRRKGGAEDNGMEEAMCSMRLQENIGDPMKADFYSRQGGHITTLNSQKLPILRYLKLSAERGHLRKNAVVSPLWHINAHSVIYCTRGSARIQIVGAGQRPLYNGQLRRGQILIVPQGYAVVKQAQDEEFEWVSFKTNDNAMVSPLAGRTSVLRGIPEGVLVNAYRISSEDARRLKFGRDFETVVLSPGRSQEGRASE